MGISMYKSYFLLVHTVGVDIHALALQTILKKNEGRGCFWQEINAKIIEAGHETFFDYY